MKKSKLFYATLATMVAVPVVVAPINSEAATYSKTFKDVSKSNAYYDIIHSMAQKGIINGYEDGTFKPNQTLSRQHAAALVCRAVALPSTTTFTAPKDVTRFTSPYYFDLVTLMEAGVLELDSKGNINPNAPLTRGEMAKILAVAFDLNTKGTTPLKDVSGTYKPYVTALYNAGVTTGFEDKTFREKESLTRAHFAVFMHRAMQYQLKNIKPVEISPDMSLEDFNQSVINNPVFDLYKPHKVAKWFWEGSEDIRKVLTEGQELLKGTDFKFSGIETYVTIDHPSWVNKYAKGFMSAPISIEGYEDEFEISFDHSNVEVTNMSLQILDLIYPDLNLTEKIAEKAEIGREALANGDKEHVDVEIVEIDGLKIRYGVIATDQYSRFIIELKN